MITRINSTQVQNKSALQNRNQKSAQNFGMIHSDVDSFKSLLRAAKAEATAIDLQCEDRIKNATLKTDTSFKTPVIDLVENVAGIIRELDNVRSGKPGMPDIVNFHELFEVKHPEINVMISAEKNDDDVFKVCVKTTGKPGKDSRCSNPYGIERESRNSSLANAMIYMTNDVNEDLKSLEMTKTQLTHNKDSVTQRLNDAHGVILNHFFGTKEQKLPNKITSKPDKAQSKRKQQH